ncbi:MAG: haloacid dehalogenase type II [Thermoleophilia bacterium]
MSQDPPRALLFDVFGTCVDWRTSVAREGDAMARRLGLPPIDWFTFADAWRGRYQPQMETVRSGARPWLDLDVLHREALDGLLADFGLDAVDERERAALTRAWHRLDPWPDTAEGLARMRSRFVVAPNSNGHIALMVALARRGGFTWDAVLGAELAGAYKPLPEVYLRSVAALGLAPGEVMMVAAHNDDLVAAAACGLRAAFVLRPTEYGPSQATDLAADPVAEVAAADLVDLAERLGA